MTRLKMFLRSKQEKDVDKLINAFETMRSGPDAFVLLVASGSILGLMLAAGLVSAGVMAADFFAHDLVESLALGRKFLLYSCGLGVALGAYRGQFLYQHQPTEQQLVEGFDQLLKTYQPVNQEAFNALIQQIHEFDGVTRPMFEQWSKIEMAAVHGRQPLNPVALPSFNHKP